MHTEIIMAGFGGQGVLLAGQLLALAGMAEGQNVTWYPSYGAEMRGGTANCSVIISDKQIGMPLINRADIVLAFNQPSIDAFVRRVAPGGALIYNSSLGREPEDHFDIDITGVQANQLASQAGSVKAVNLVMLSAALKLTGILSRESLVKALKLKFKGPKEKLIALNLKAVDLGWESVTSHKLPAKYEAAACLIKDQTTPC